jgi:hypothetical protein
VQVPRNSLDAIIEQEADQNDSVYPPSAHVEMKEDKISEGKQTPPSVKSTTTNKTKHAQTEPLAAPKDAPKPQSVATDDSKPKTKDDHVHANPDDSDGARR